MANFIEGFAENFVKNFQYPYISKQVISTGEASDVVSVGKAGDTQTSVLWGVENSTLDTGLGDDGITIEGFVDGLWSMPTAEEASKGNNKGNGQLIAGAGNDSIKIKASGRPVYRSNIDLGSGNDSLRLESTGSTNGYGSSFPDWCLTMSSINAGDGDDSIEGNSSKFATSTTINLGSGNDQLKALFSRTPGDDGLPPHNFRDCEINAGDGDDTLYIWTASNTTINGGNGNDKIKLYGPASDWLIKYTYGPNNQVLSAIAQSNYTIDKTGAINYLQATPSLITLINIEEIDFDTLGAGSDSTINLAATAKQSQQILPTTPINPQAATTQTAIPPRTQPKTLVPSTTPGSAATARPQAANKQTSSTQKPGASQPTTRVQNSRTSINASTLANTNKNRAGSTAINSPQQRSIGQPLRDTITTTLRSLPRQSTPSTANRLPAQKLLQDRSRAELSDAMNLISHESATRSTSITRTGAQIVEQDAIINGNRLASNCGSRTETCPPNQSSARAMAAHLLTNEQSFSAQPGSATGQLPFAIASAFRPDCLGQQQSNIFEA